LGADGKRAEASAIPSLGAVAFYSPEKVSVGGHNVVRDARRNLEAAVILFAYLERGAKR